MKNPWEEILLTDYENHMKLESVMQLQAMNVFKKQSNKQIRNMFHALSKSI